MTDKTEREAAIRKSMTSEQIQLERKLTCEQIDGAMALGYLNANPPSSDDHWLAPFWKIGRKQAELEAAVAQQSVVPAGYALVSIEPPSEEACAEMAECLPEDTYAADVWSEVIRLGSVAVPSLPAPADELSQADGYGSADFGYTLAEIERTNYGTNNGANHG